MNQQRTRQHHLLQVIAGGQTGVDRAALDAARAAGLAIGGWCPLGRRAEDGPIDAAYPLRETPSTDYAERTAWNVRDSDATLVLAAGEPAGGTAWTRAVAQELKRPCQTVDLAVTSTRAAQAERGRRVWAWLAEHHVAVLNVAGPRASEGQAVYERAYAFLQVIFARGALGGSGV